jgi:hypothetical protein
MPSIEGRRREIIQQVGSAIAELGNRVSTDVGIADEISAVSVKAKDIAFRAWQAMLGGQGSDLQQTVHELVGDLSHLADQLAGLAGRAGRHAVVTHDPASLLALVASEFAAIADDADLLRDEPKLRARLRSLAEQLGTIPGKLAEGKAIATAFTGAAKTAATLAERSSKVCDKRAAVPMLQIIYDGVRDLANETSRVGTLIIENLEHGRRAMTAVKSCVDRLAHAKDQSGLASGHEQLAAIIDRGGAIVW